MPDIGLGIAAADRAVTLRINGPLVGDILGIFQIDSALPSEKSCMTCISCRHYAIKEVNATRNCFNDIRRCSHAHEITRFVFWQYLVHDFNHLVHLFGRFAHCETAYSVAIGFMFGDIFCRAFSEFWIYAALYDREQRLVIVINRFSLVETFPAAVEPAMCSFHRLFSIAEVGGAWSTFIESHDAVSYTHLTLPTSDLV